MTILMSTPNSPNFQKKTSRFWTNYRKRWEIFTGVVCLLLSVLFFGQNLSDVDAAAKRAAAQPSLAPLPVEYSGYWQYERCEDCHSQVSELSHPVDIRPSMLMPKGFKLKDGRLSCITCHRGESALEHAASRQNHDKLLRGSRRGRDFCLNCHAASDTQAMHGMVLGQVHGSNNPMAAEIGFASTAASSENAFTQRPVTSQTCMDCHQGTGGPDIGHGHSYNVPYTNKFAGLTGIRHMGLKAKSQLDPRIRLFDGKVQCLSCHSPFSDHSKMLVMDNRSQQLCRACHETK